MSSQQHIIARGQRFESRGVVVLIDDIKDGDVLYRRWKSGSDGTLQGDWDAFLGANRMPVWQFSEQLKGVNQ